MSQRSQVSERMRETLANLFIVIGCFAVMPSSSAIAASRACSVNATNDIQYLIFWPPLPGTTDNYEARIKDFAAKLGTTGDDKTRQLGFGIFIPVWAGNPSAITRAIKGGFDLAKRTNVAVHFNVDDHIEWDERPDLWNWYDPSKPGFNPENRKNVEWYDWEGVANKRRYLTPAGAPSQTPHMCYGSPAVQKEISRIVSQIVGPALKVEINELKKENKEYLFAGITVGAEAGFDDYSRLPGLLVRLLLQARGLVDPMASQMALLLGLAERMMDEDKAPHSQVGYCSLTNAGYSRSHPAADINVALTDINRKFIEFWDKQFFEADIPCSRIYTHVAASVLQSDNAPLSIVFNPYARPGWTTYPQSILENGFQPLYAELAKHGNPAWGGVEANNFSNPKAPWEKYLAWHYNHGAKLVGISIGAADQSLMSALSKSATGDEAIAAYQKFLRGGILLE
jgi:hypothetical protein